MSLLLFGFLISLLTIIILIYLLIHKKDCFVPIPTHTINPTSIATNCDVAQQIMILVNDQLNEMFPTGSPVGNISLTIDGNTFTIPDTLFSDFTVPSISFGNSNPGSTTMLIQPSGNGTLVNPASNTWNKMTVLNASSLTPFSMNQHGVYYTNVYDRVGAPICSNTFDYMKDLSLTNMSILDFNNFVFTIENTDCQTIAREKDQTVSFNWSIENNLLAMGLSFGFFGCDGGTGFCGLTWDLQCANNTQNACPDAQVCVVESEISGSISVDMTILCKGTGSFKANATNGELTISDMQIIYGSETTTLTNDNYTINNAFLSLVNVSVSTFKNDINKALTSAVSKLGAKVLPKVVGLINTQLNSQTITFQT